MLYTLLVPQTNCGASINGGKFEFFFSFLYFLEAVLNVAARLIAVKVMNGFIINQTVIFFPLLHITLH